MESNPTTVPAMPSETMEVLPPEERTYENLTKRSRDASARIAEINKPYVDALRQADLARHASMADRFNQLLEFFDSNEALRSAEMKACFALERLCEKEAAQDPNLDKLEEALKPGVNSYDKRFERFKAFREHQSKMRKEATANMLKIMQERRRTEFCDENHMHLAGFHYVWTMMKGALNRRLQGRPELQLLLDDMRKIADGLDVYIGRR